ncbi:BMP family protein [Glaciihabitans sp. dw_435]|uniref:BMP family lipoprotein n=1 Tax=Glaciihabitans sp. dw_435 TaxID=2720081 RepID=UPI001BD523E7|nr:BMP family ABC transporter substrate-binding protein [Glaciihabitans sp. dw_435]
MNVITRKRGLAGLALLGAAGLLLAGCSAAPTASSTAKSVDFKGCAVSDEGSWQDKSFNEAAYEGLMKAKTDLGITTADAESNSTEDFDPNLAQMVSAKCDLTFAVGFNLIDPVNAAAAANPDFNFVTIDGSVTDAAKTPNLKAINYSMAQSSYLAGYLAAAYSTSKVIGTYGGLDIPAVTEFMEGFYYGAKAYEKETGTAVKVLGAPVGGGGTFTDPGKSFGDTEGAKTISAGQIADGADVIFPVAGGLFSATAEAIKESGKPVVFIGVDKNIAVTSPEYKDLVLTSVEKRMTQAVYDVIDDTIKNGFSSKAYLGTLENDGTDLSDFGAFDSKVSDEIKDKLKTLKAGIIDGSIDPLK